MFTSYYSYFPLHQCSAKEERLSGFHLFLFLLLQKKNSRFMEMELFFHLVFLVTIASTAGESETEFAEGMLKYVIWVPRGLTRETSMCICLLNVRKNAGNDLSLKRMVNRDMQLFKGFECWYSVFVLIKILQVKFSQLKSDIIIYKYFAWGALVVSCKLRLSRVQYYNGGLLLARNCQQSVISLRRHKLYIWTI